ncbi:MAG TPA: Rieske (2Fe-2S) protein [Micromonosporaceae bacterium]|nr:Rieske (2Fe-2S) protein [Micromonosporaceae bacterium]
MTPTRRNVLAAAGAVGLAGTLAACGKSTVDTDSAEGSGRSGYPTADIPVGGGAIYQADEVVVTQPTAGQFRAFSAVCTHQGCLVSSVSSGRIVCACHNSAFSISDGSVLAGPATRALSSLTASVDGSTVTVG